MRALALLAMATPLAAEEAPLTGAEITRLMPGIHFDHGGVWQDFEPGGVTHTVYRNGRRDPGRWWIEGDSYCEELAHDPAPRCGALAPGRRDAGTLHSLIWTLTDGARIEIEIEDQ